MKRYKPIIRDFVQNGGRYIGFCLGAYLAGHDPGFDLLSPKDDADEEVSQPGAQVTDDEEDTVIQIDWTFTTGPRKGQTEHKRWLYFQDGAMFDVAKGSKAQVLGRYSSNGDVAAMLTSFGAGWVGLVGPHPEADESWCESCSRCGYGCAMLTLCKQMKMPRSVTLTVSILTSDMILSRPQ